jgi:sugar phosphate isomerase/epimerase
MASSAGMTRRSFLARAGSSAAAGVLPGRLWAAGRAVPAGIQLYTVGSDLAKDPAGTLKRLRQIGFIEVESAGLAKQTPAAFRSLVREAGLRLPSAHMQFGFEATEKLLAEGEALGVEYVVSSILPPRVPESGMRGVLQMLNTLTATDFHTMASLANEIGRKAKAAGLRYAYHNHNIEFRDVGGGETGYAILLRETDPAVVQFEADTGWMRVAGADPVKLLEEHPERFAMLHVKDFKNLGKPVTTLMTPDAPQPTELGRGGVDVGAIVAAGLRAGVRHIFVEQEPPFADMPAMEAAAVDYAALRPMLA